MEPLAEEALAQAGWSATWQADTGPLGFSTAAGHTELRIVRQVLLNVA